MKTSTLALALLPAILFATDDRPAYRADDLVDSVGISAGLFETSTKYDLKHFDELGIRYYRTVLRYANTPEDQPQKIEDQWRRTGAKPLFLLDSGKSRTVKAEWMGVKEDGDFSFLIEDLKRYVPESISALESPNELNNKFPPQDLNMKYKGRTDEIAGSLYQKELYEALKSDPVTARIPVVMYTAIFTDYMLARPCDSFDFLNTHSYQGDGVPSSSLLMNFGRTWNILPTGATIGRFVPTECGYNVDLDKTNGMGYIGSLRAQAYNLPMLVAEYFRHGIARTYLFSLPNVDGYGLLESDNTTRRPSWYALQSFLALLKDSTWASASCQWKGGRDFPPRALRFDLEGAPDTVHTLTLQKENGDWYLLLWNEIRNRRDGADTKNPDVPATLRFADGTPVRCTGMWRQGEISRERPESGAFVPVDAAEWKIDGNRMTLSIPSHVLVLRFAPEKKAAGAAAPSVTLAEAAPATANSASVALSLPANAAFASVALFRNDLHIKTFQRDEFKASDNVLATTYTDASAWVRPGLGYRYDARAIAEDGTQGPLANLVVVTPDKRPDLGIADFGPVLPAGRDALRAGDVVSFAGTIWNWGEGPTLNPTEGDVGMYNSAIALTFSVDGQVIGWGGDGGQTPMQPGEFRRVEANGGGPLQGRWKATEGVHIVKAYVDDINRISNERGKFNNIGSRTLTVGDYAGRLDMESRTAAWRYDLSREGVRDWVCFNGWGEGAAPSRKKGADLIGLPRQVGKGYVNVNPGCGIQFTWGDDATTGATEHTNAGLWGNGVGNGYAFEVPAGTEERVLKVYVGVTNGGAGEFSAELSDGSAPAFTDATWNSNRAGRSTPVPGEVAVVYTLRYRAASEGQTLRVTWKLADEPNRAQFLAQIRLQAATLE